MGEEMILGALNSRYCCLKEPSVDRRYLTSLHVYGTREDDEPQSPQTLGQNIIDPQILKKKITAAISALSFREPDVLVQFWLPVTFMNRCVLTTLDQPFGIGVVNEALYSYRLESEQHIFPVYGEHIEELGPPGRVYRQRLPEWSLDIKGLPTSQNIKDSNACYNIRGYLSLPVLDPASGCSVGVLELITVSKHVDYAFEVLEISKALKGQDLKTSNAFEDPSFCELPSEDRQIQVAKIYDILKVMCDTHNLPLAQTWELSPLGSYVSHEKSIQKSCSSFNRRCIGKVCMSTAGLPFYVRDPSMWEFHNACIKQHLEKSRGVVGRALLSHCSSYCENVTKLSEEEYPLVRNACTSGLGGCFAIFLHGVEGKNDYILEFFIPLDIKNRIYSYVLNLVRKLKSKIEASSFEMGDISSIEVIKPSSVVNNISSMTEVDTPNGIIPHPFVTNVATIACGAFANVSMQKTRDKGSDAGKPSNRLIQSMKTKRKTKRDFVTMEEVKKHIGKSMNEAIEICGVSRSTLKRILRVLGLARWPRRKLCVRRTNICLNSLPRITHSNQHLAVSKGWYQSHLSEDLSFSTTVGIRGRFLSKPALHVYHVAKLIVCLRRWKKRSFARIAMAHQNDPAVFNNNTTYMEQATNNVERHIDVDLDKVADLNCVDAFPRLSGADFIDDQGSFWRMAGCSSGSVLDYLMEPDGIENAMTEIGMGLEGALFSPIGSGDMSLFDANNFNLISDD